MIHSTNTSTTDSTMMCPRWSVHFTSVKQNIGKNDIVFFNLAQSYESMKVLCANFIYLVQIVQSSSGGCVVLPVSSL